MNKRIKKLWIKALRSGEYEQGYGQLKRTCNRKSYYCCLGVLEDLAVQAGVIKSFNGANGDLDVIVQKWAGLFDSLPSAGRQRLHFLNDTQRDFNYIADRIEKYL